MSNPEIAVLNYGERLDVARSGGQRRSIDARTLWVECPSAGGRRRRIDGTHALVPPGLRITEVTEVGAYGLHVAFSADVRGGVFPWPMLIELSERPQVADFITPAA
jgi:DUF971 family protein